MDIAQSERHTPLQLRYEQEHQPEECTLGSWRSYTNRGLTGGIRASLLEQVMSLSRSIV